MTDAELFGRRIFQADDVNLLLANMALDLIVMMVLVGFLYYRQTRDRDHTFMMVTLNLVVFLVAFFMNSVEVGVGFGFGLFALFGIVRYRTESVPVREMSYLFVTIALGLTNAIGATVLSWSEVLVANVSIIIIIGTLSQLFWRKSVVVRDVVYDQIDNIRPDRRRELFEDLWTRLGLRATDVELVSVNLLNETAVLRVSCDTSRNQHQRRTASDIDGDLRYDVGAQPATTGANQARSNGGAARTVAAPTNGNGRPPTNGAVPQNGRVPVEGTAVVNGSTTRHVAPRPTTNLPPITGISRSGDGSNGTVAPNGPGSRAIGGYPPPRPPQGGSGPLEGR